MRRVLIIDDEEFFARLVARNFGRRHWLPVICPNMEDALEKIKTINVDLILTDIFMPGIGGIAGIELLKEKTKDIPIIAMSGGWDTLKPDEALNAAIKTGAHGGLSKPIRPDELEELLKVFELDGDKISAPQWPQTPNETTDWDAVFDTPVNGVIAWINAASASDLLKMTTLNVFEELFQNTRTELDAKTYLENVKTIIDRSNSGNKTETLKEIIGLLTEIKTTFKEEDASFIAERNMNSFDKRPRAPEATNTSSNPNKKYMILGGIAAALIAIIIGFSVSSPEQKQKPKPIEKPAVAKKPTKSTRPTKKVETPGNMENSNTSEKGGVYKPDLKSLAPPKKATADMPVLVALSEIEWSPSSNSQRLPPVRIVPLLQLRSADFISATCNRTTEMNSIIQASLSSIANTGTKPNRSDLQKAASGSTSPINKAIGKGAVKNIVFVTGLNIGKIIMINAPCRRLSLQETQALRSIR